MCQTMNANVVFLSSIAHTSILFSSFFKYNVLECNYCLDKIIVAGFVHLYHFKIFFQKAICLFPWEPKLQLEKNENTSLMECIDVRVRNFHFLFFCIFFSLKQILIHLLHMMRLTIYFYML